MTYLNLKLLTYNSHGTKASQPRTSFQKTIIFVGTWQTHLSIISPMYSCVNCKDFHLVNGYLSSYCIGPDATGLSAFCQKAVIFCWNGQTFLSIISDIHSYVRCTNTKVPAI